MRFDTLSALNAARSTRRAVALVTELEGGEQRLVEAQQASGDPLAEALEARFRSGASGTVSLDGRSYFVAVQLPPVRLMLIGAVHISQALCEGARLAGLDVTVIDPRTAFASPERFGTVKLVADWPDRAIPAIGLDRYTAVAALTHDPRIDDPALEAALRAECFYIGALGSRKTHAARIGRLEAAGFDQAAIGRIRAPIGLDIGAVSPAEIAVAILGEIIAAMRKKPLRSDTGSSTPRSDPRTQVPA